MNPALLQQPFFQVTLPLVVTFVAAIWAATWSQNKRFEDWKKVLEDLKTDMNRQFTELRAEMTRRFDKRDTKLARSSTSNRRDAVLLKRLCDLAALRESGLQAR